MLLFHHKLPHCLFPNPITPMPQPNATLSLPPPRGISSRLCYTVDPSPIARAPVIFSLCRRFVWPVLSLPYSPHFSTIGLLCLTVATVIFLINLVMISHIQTLKVLSCFRNIENL
ncbi:unnamed protein product [Lathyrus oleraceus]|uniref:uncharacterized protein LOC127119648 isoform X2 n=1 Tax=Pisum sativum TaxID=3888 RepID=UPI001FC65B86|nr:uncharacterized protein LOC127119648 isoform X2 [Pisum sativum]